MGKLDGKVALVTGAAIGLGEATARLFAAEGAKVVVSDWDVERGPTVADDISSGGGTATFVKADVSKTEDVRAMVQATVDTYGGLHVLFNNAGIVGDTASTTECTEENWDAVVDINLKGTFLGMKYGIPAMLKSGGGSIINNASTSGLVGFPELPAYSAAKGGIVILTKTAALEFAKQGIRVNVICAGTIMTPMVQQFMDSKEGMQQFLESKVPMGRFGTAEEFAQFALFLASDDSAWCTGAEHIMDGGILSI
ncbi:MAG: SDR family oxidoreductase [Chloroflexi bacterium]|nr:SDR family oxidoreductase [Chloroflexota bacterium]